MLNGPGDISVATVADPVIEDPADVIVRVALAGICGSDLHLLRGHGVQCIPGTIPGHEAVGTVIAAGEKVRRVQVGDRVLLPGSPGCGFCDRCSRNESALCRNLRSTAYGLSPQLPGSQAGLIRVPFADFNCVHVPETITDAEAVLLTDNFPTAWFGVRSVGIQPGDTVAVIGLGAVGQLAVRSALLVGAARVIALDPNAIRRDQVEKAGAIAAAPGPASVVRERNDGDLADVVIEAVGRAETVNLALQLAAPGGRVSVLGVVDDRGLEFPFSYFQGKSLTMHSGLCSVHRELPSLLQLVSKQRASIGDLVSIAAPLTDAPKIYQRLTDADTDLMKAVIRPQEF